MNTEPQTLTLTRREVDAIASYVWNHVRAYPNSAAYKVWAKMHALIEKDEKDEAVMPLFD